MDIKYTLTVLAIHLIPGPPTPPLDLIPDPNETTAEPAGDDKSVLPTESPDTTVSQQQTSTTPPVQSHTRAVGMEELMCDNTSVAHVSPQISLGYGGGRLAAILKIVRATDRNANCFPPS